MPTPTTIDSSPSTTKPSPPATAAVAAPRPFRLTTSWDDGHPLDWRIAELLAKYDLPGTFYIPRASQCPTMPPADVRRLSAQFEIGGHTLDHLPLTTLSAGQAAHQIHGCKTWLEDVVGRPCTAFCPPLGKFRPDHLDLIRQAGFRTVRTVEFLSLDFPRADHGLRVLPTTLQAYPHRLLAYARNALRRRSASNLLRALLNARGNDWVALCRRMLNAAVRHGGVLHLWGHSWEIDETDQWHQLEETFRFLASHTTPIMRVSNTLTPLPA